MGDYGDYLRKERRSELSMRVLPNDVEEQEAPALYTYEIEIDDTEFGFMPPFIKANIIKGLEKKLAAETDDEKKAEIQAKIDKLKGNKKEEMASRLEALLDEKS